MTTLTPANGNGKTVRVVTGQHIAKAHRRYSPRARAEDAACWIRGEVQVAPTVKLAASVFKISVPLVMKARAVLGDDHGVHAHHGNGNGTTTLSDAAINRIIAEEIAQHRHCVLQAFERMRQLQAAE
jgi:hypothetical protein